MKPFVIRKPLGERVWRMFAVLAAFVVLPFVVFAWDAMPMNHRVLWPALLAAVIGVHLHHGRDRRPFQVVDDTGVYLRSIGTTTPWSAIMAAEVRRPYKRAAFIVLRLAGGKELVLRDTGSRWGGSNRLVQEIQEKIEASRRSIIAR